MPDRKPVAQSACVRYLYDGSLAGFYCCVHRSFYTRQIPLAICPAGEAQPCLWPEETIETDEVMARRVQAATMGKLSSRVSDLTENVFFSCMEQKETALLRFLHRAFAVGPQITNMLGDPDVAALLKAELHLHRESHLFLGFVRFQDTGGALTATIAPKNFVLPYIANHFVSRFSGENFMIFDKTHNAALIYQNRKKQIVRAEGLVPPLPTKDEQYYRSLWKQFYDTVAIAARENPRCRMTHMPKRYWDNLTEMQEF
jgi:probable DNA metabolism protein